MSREERRQYQRQMRNMERGPALPPAAKARAERNAARRGQRRGSAGTSRSGASSRRFWIRALLVAVVLGFLAFSVQWGNGMPVALYVGLGVAAAVLVLAALFRYLRRRAMSLGRDPGSPAR